MKKGLVRISALFFSTFFRFKTVWSAKMENRLRFAGRSKSSAIAVPTGLVFLFYHSLLPKTSAPSLHSRVGPSAFVLLMPLSFRVRHEHPMFSVPRA